VGLAGHRILRRRPWCVTAHLLGPQCTETSELASR
jgi:hypothetical protein